MTAPSRDAEPLPQPAEADRIEHGPLRVLVVHNRYRSDAPSGENDVVDSEIAALRELGHAVVAYQRSSDEIDALPLGQRATLPIRSIHSRRDNAAVLELVACHRPDIVHVHNLNPLISPAVIPSVRRTGTPVVMTVHNFRLACANGLFFRDGGECRQCMGRRFATPAVRHACYRGSRAQSMSLATTLTAHRGSYMSVDHFVALSPTIATFLDDLGVPASRVTVKPNTVADPGPASDPPLGRFLFVGRLTPSKGPAMLVNAWLRQPEGALGQLTLLGSGSEQDTIRQLIGTRGDVRMLGQVKPADVSSHLKEHGVVVAPSRWAEAFPRVVAEALAHGRPVVTTRVGSLPEIIGDAGWIAEPSPDDLARALREAADSDIAAAGARARARYEQCYAPAVVNHALVALYRKVAAAARFGNHEDT